MTEQQKPPQPAPAPKKKAKGPIRVEVLLPLVIFCALVWAYFFFLFDGHLRRLIEFAGYHIVGAEVNVGSLESSFTKGTVRIQRIQITNPQKPTHNMIEIGDIRFGLLWDGLLRARFIVEEMAAEQIGVNIPRKSPGAVKPPPPPPPESKEPSALEKEAEKLKKQTLEKLQKENAANLFGDIAAILSGANAGDQFKALEDSLPSKAKMKELEAGYNERRTKWDAKLQTLPQGKDIQSISERLAKVKTSGFANPQELADSVNQAQALIKEADEKFKTVQGAAGELDTDLKYLDAGVKELDALVKADIKTLEARFRIPKLDAKTLARGIFGQYLDPYLARINTYKAMAEKYIPPKYLKKGKEKDPEPEFQPHPRASGVTYEFGRPNSYPMFWVKKISVSSKANQELGIGDLSGQILNVTSNQAIIGRPTEMKLTGSFPVDRIEGVKLDLAVDTRGEASKISYDFGVGSYPVEPRQILESTDVQLKLNQAVGAFTSTGVVTGLKEYTLKLSNVLRKSDFTVTAKNEVVDEVLKNVFKALPDITIDAGGRGEFPELTVDFESNIGPELARGLERQVSLKIEEAKAKLNAFVQDQVGKEKAKVEAEIAKFRAQLDGEVKKLQAQLDAQKKQAEQKVETAKKDAENRANAEKKAAEDRAKKQLEDESKKAADELKKRFGL